MNNPPDQTHLDFAGRWIYEIGLEIEVSGEISFSERIGGKLVTGYSNFPNHEQSLFNWQIGPRFRAGDYSFVTATAGVVVSSEKQFGPAFGLQLRYILPGNDEVVGQSTLR